MTTCGSRVFAADQILPVDIRLLTTVEVLPFTSDRIHPVGIPSYNYFHPSINTRTLGAEREGIFNPQLSAFRRMEMDSIAGRLSDENSTKCTRDDFRRATTSLFIRLPERMPCLGITETAKEIFKHQNAADELRNERLDWCKFLDKCPERYNIRLNEMTDHCCGRLEFEGYAVRYLRPSVTASWRRPLSRYIPSSSVPTCGRCFETRSFLPF